MERFLKKRNVAVLGLTVTAVWSVLQVLISAVFGPLGNTKGIEIGPYIIGAVSHYWDPFLLGLSVVFTGFAWRHRPDDPFMGTIEIVLCGLFLLCIMVGIGSIGKISDLVLLLIVLGCLITGPICFLSVYSLVAIFPLIIVGIDRGITITLLLVIGAWLGKWTIWWVYNILWLGTRAAREKLNELRRAEIPPATEL